MKKLLFCFLLFFTLLNANELVVKESIFIDQNSSMTLEEIITKKEQFEPIKKYNMGITKDTVWIKLQIQNTTDKKILKRLYNQRYRLEFIDVYIFKNNTMTHSYKLGALQEHSVRDNHFRASYFDIKLLPKESMEIFIKQKTFSTMEVKWHISNIDAFDDYFQLLDMIYFTVFGMIFIIIIGSMMLYFLLKNNYYIIYSLFAFFSVTYQFSLAGYFYEFGLPLYFNTISLYAFSEIAVIFLAFFPFSFFGLKQGEYKILSLLIKIIVVLKIFIVLGYFFYSLNSDFIYSSKYASLSSMILMIILLLLSMRTFIDKKTGSAFYLLANIFLTSAAIYFVLGLQGVFPTTPLLYYALAIGVVGQDFFLALALVYATYKIKNVHEKQKELVDEYSKLSFLGQTVINIYHQWKTPVNNIYNSINHIEIAKEFQDENLHTIIDENLMQIKNNTQYLKNTAVNYLEHYKQIDQEPTNTNIYDEISSVIKLIELESIKINLKVSVYCNKSLFLHLKRNHFANMLMILLENSITEFKLKSIKKPMVKIVIKKENGTVVMEIEDNAGGVNMKPIEKIFEQNHSANSSSGIGLYLLKEYLLPKLNATVSVVNYKDGIKFTFIF